jgi:N,N'-diacetyllegionaminate synthase
MGNASAIRIIAEAGVNHNGSLKQAKRLVDIAKQSGVDFVKFQSFDPTSLTTANARTARYQGGAGFNNQLQMLSEFILTIEQLAELKRYCESVGIGFISTAFDLKSVDVLQALNQTIWKVASGEITNVPLLERVGSIAHEVILSTGMATLGEIEQAIALLENAGCTRSQVVVLHCNTEYPTPFTDVNLRAMTTIGTAFGVRVGYSDHTPGIAVSVAAVALGASIIEKHFTTDRNLPGPDHKASLEPNALKELVKAIRNVEEALGCDQKVVSPSEEKNRTIVRKGIYASRSISKGEVFSDVNLTTKRPEHQVGAALWYQIIGRKADRDYEMDDPIQL